MPFFQNGCTQNRSDIHFSAKEFELIAKVTGILVYFEQATKILSKPDASIAMSIPIITTIQKALKPCKNKRTMA